MGGVTATGAVLVGRELGGTGAPAQAVAAAPDAASPAPLLTTDAVDWGAVAAAIQPSVVSISVTTPFGGGQGSGIIYDAAGHIVTNNHVVEAAQQSGTLQVNLADGRVFAATIIGLDPATDLAVIQMTDPPGDLTPATIGDSSVVAVGDPVMAVGNPLGLSGTVTTGIVSALDRPVTASDGSGQSQQGTPVVTAAIQTDAAVNPGNSGGALVDAAGRVIGVNSAIASLGSSFGGQSGSIGLGFAIPGNEVRAVADQLIDTGTAQHARMGVRLDDTVAGGPDGDRAAAAIVDVTSGAPAAAAGLRPGDAVIAVDDRSVTGALAMTAIVRSYQPGETVSLTVLREGRQRIIEVTLVAADEQTS